MPAQVQTIWRNAATGAELLCGQRLYPLLQTPWRFFAPPGVDRGRCLVLSSEVHTVPVACVAQRCEVHFQAVATAAQEAEVCQTMSTRQDALLCHLRVTDGGGVDNVACGGCVDI